MAGFTTHASPNFTRARQFAGAVLGTVSLIAVVVCVFAIPIEFTNDDSTDYVSYWLYALIGVGVVVTIALPCASTNNSFEKNVPVVVMFATLGVAVTTTFVCTAYCIAGMAWGFGALMACVVVAAVSTVVACNGK